MLTDKQIEEIKERLAMVNFGQQESVDTFAETSKSDIEALLADRQKLKEALMASQSHILDDGKCEACRLYNEAMADETKEPS